MAWKREQFAVSVLPRNFQTGDILRRSRLEALKQEGLSMFQVLATVFEPEGKDRAPNKESSVIQKAREQLWGLPPETEVMMWTSVQLGLRETACIIVRNTDSPSATQENYKEDWLRTQNIPHVLQQGIWLKNYVLPTSRNSKKPYWGSSSCT